MSREYFKNLLDKFFLQARAQFGSAVKSQWLYEGEACPGCGGEVGAVKTKGGDVLSLNAFIYRERGVLIGYVLCNKCAKHIYLSGNEKESVPRNPSTCGN